LKYLGLPVYKTDKDKLSKLIDDNEMEKKLLLVFEGKETYNNIIKIVYPDAFSLPKQDLSKSKIVKKSISDVPLIVDNNTLTNCTLCPECNPKVFDKIIAKSSKV
jgi:hypothetical protein